MQTIAQQLREDYLEPKNNSLYNRSMINKIKLLIALLLVSTVCCYGYIDPGTGSYVVQIVIAAAAGAAFGIKLFWKRIKAFLGRNHPLPGKTLKKEDEAPPNQE